MRVLQYLLICLVTCLPALASAYDRDLVEEMLKSQEGIAGLKRHEAVLDGQKVFYLDNERDKAARTIMFVHGFGDSGTSWMFLARLFRDAGYRILIPDLPGFGRSARNATADYGYTAQANRLFLLLQNLKVGQVHLVGNSMGGGIVGQMALLRPQAVASLTLIDAAGVHYKATELDQQVLKGNNFLIPKKTEDFARLLDFVMARRPIMPQPIVDYLAERAISDSALHERIFHEVLLPDVGFLTLGLADIKTPTLILWGERDRVLHPENARVFQRYIAGSRLTYLPGIGHTPMAEAPEETGAAILGFIDELYAEAPTLPKANP
ncbi:MAG: alpha/beta fold hydrolase [Moraxellaceae bacterium]|jgi:pimeloyl-ACP methyl ester carboxylesterase|nr:alpha/beta fold hydrolase [Moraxellaceae bacterium]